MRSLGMILDMQPRERCEHRDRGKGSKASKRPHDGLLDGIFRPFPRLSFVMYLDTLLARRRGTVSKPAYKNSTVKSRQTLKRVNNGTLTRHPASERVYGHLSTPNL